MLVMWSAVLGLDQSGIDLRLGVLTHSNCNNFRRCFAYREALYYVDICFFFLSLKVLARLFTSRYYIRLESSATKIFMDDKNIDDEKK